MTSLPAQPTLTGIPAECRRQILQLVLEDADCTLKLSPLHGNRTNKAFDVPHPLLLVSKGIHQEALEFYHITLDISRSYVNDAAFSATRQPLSLRESISNVVLRVSNPKMSICSVNCDGYRADVINKELFPKLRTVTHVGALAPSRNRDFQPPTVRHHVPQYILLDRRVSIADMQKDVYLESQFSQAKQAGSLTFKQNGGVELEPLPDKKRGFQLLWEVCIEFKRPSRLIMNPWLQSLGEVTVTWDYDSGKLVKKSSWNNA